MTYLFRLKSENTFSTKQKVRTYSTARQEAKLSRTKKTNEETRLACLLRPNSRLSGLEQETARLTNEMAEPLLLVVGQPTQGSPSLVFLYFFIYWYLPSTVFLKIKFSALSLCLSLPPSPSPSLSRFLMQIFVLTLVSRFAEIID
jgi:hypothetical protein